MELSLEQMEEISKAGYRESFEKLGRLFGTVGIETDGTTQGTIFHKNIQHTNSFREQKEYEPVYNFDEMAALNKMKEMGIIKE